MNETLGILITLSVVWTILNLLFNHFRKESKSIKKALQENFIEISYYIFSILLFVGLKDVMLTTMWLYVIYFYIMYSFLFLVGFFAILIFHKKKTLI
jgi:hypothetical protein